MVAFKHLVGGNYQAVPLKLTQLFTYFPAITERSVIYSDYAKNTLIKVDVTSTGALLPGKANPAHTQTMEFFQED